MSVEPRVSIPLVFNPPIWVVVSLPAWVVLTAWRLLITVAVRPGTCVVVIALSCVVVKRATFDDESELICVVVSSPMTVVLNPRRLVEVRLLSWVAVKPWT